MSIGVDEIVKIALTSGFSILATIVALRAKRSTDREDRDDAAEKAARAAHITGQHDVLKEHVKSDTEALRMAYARIKDLEIARDETLKHSFEMQRVFLDEREAKEAEIAKLRAVVDDNRDRCEAEVAQITAAFHAATRRAESAEMALAKVGQLTQRRLEESDE